MEMVDYPAAIALLYAIGLCKAQGPQNHLVVSEELEGQDDDRVAGLVSNALVELLEQQGVFNPTKLVFDSESGRTYLPLHLFPMKLAPYRNLLVELGGLVREGKRLYLSETIKNGIASRQIDGFDGMTPEQLMAKLEQNQLAGEQAERFVMDYEKSRLGSTKGKEVQQVSAISVSAGFDIASFENVDSVHYDRLIEVKAIGKDGFYLSSNELDAARKHGRSYYLYLVNLGQASKQGYEPMVIRNPAESANDYAEVRGGHQAGVQNFGIV